MRRTIAPGRCDVDLSGFAHPLPRGAGALDVDVVQRLGDAHDEGALLRRRPARPRRGVPVVELVQKRSPDRLAVFVSGLALFQRLPRNHERPYLGGPKPAALPAAQSADADDDHLAERSTAL